MFFYQKQAYSLKWIKNASEGWEILSKFTESDQKQKQRNLLQYASKGYHKRQYKEKQLNIP